jgi:hypothetical protein
VSNEKRCGYGEGCKPTSRSLIGSIRNDLSLGPSVESGRRFIEDIYGAHGPKRGKGRSVVTLWCQGDEPLPWDPTSRIRRGVW